MIFIDGLKYIGTLVDFIIIICLHKIINQFVKNLGILSAIRRGAVSLPAIVWRLLSGRSHNSAFHISTFGGLPRPRCSAEVVLTSLLFEEIELLEGLQSVDGEDELSVSAHTETLLGVLELHIIEDDGGNVVGVLLGEGLIWSGLDLGEELASVVLDSGGNLLAELSGVVISLGLGEGDSERHILIDLLEIGLHGSEESGLRVLLDLGGLRPSSFVGSNIFLSDGIWSNIRKSRDEFVVTWVMSVFSKRGQVGSLRGRDEGGNSKSKEFHYLF